MTFSDAIIDEAVTSARRALAILDERLIPQHTDARRELRATGVSPAHIDALYPWDIGEYVNGLNTLGPQLDQYAWLGDKLDEINPHGEMLRWLPESYQNQIPPEQRKRSYGSFPAEVQFKWLLVGLHALINEPFEEDRRTLLGLANRHYYPEYQAQWDNITDLLEDVHKFLREWQERQPVSH